MLKKVCSERGTLTNGWISLDPVDMDFIEAVYKKNIREGEERLMLAVLESAVADFQKYVLSKDEKERKLFQEAEEWFLKKESDQLFSFEYICARSWGSLRLTYGGGCSTGRKQSSRQVLLTTSAQVAGS
jgi:hypothetical protein